MQLKISSLPANNIGLPPHILTRGGTSSGFGAQIKRINQALRSPIASTRRGRPKVKAEYSRAVQVSIMLQYPFYILQLTIWLTCH
jgi:hypothetical protein